MSNAPIPACPFCKSDDVALTIMQSGKMRVVCKDCDAQGPAEELADLALARWAKRPEAEFWQESCIYLADCHAANSMEYEVKSVSVARRSRQVRILSIAEEITLLREKTFHKNWGTIEARTALCARRLREAIEGLSKVNQAVLANKMEKEKTP
jgi:formate-dependent nitrite reductase cytochrome c552 subunit